jgi:hypothetical protein
MTEPRKYLYCIIRCSEERTFDGVTPIGGAAAAVHTLHSNGLAAVVSDAHQPDYETTRANMLAHQRVLERVMQEFTLLPVRFGTVASSPSPDMDIRRLLERRSREFSQLLAEMDGCVELGFKALWRDEKAILGELLEDNPGIRRLRDSLKGRPPAAVHFEGIRLGEMVKGALDQKKKTEAAGILAAIRPVAGRVVENPPFMDRMVVNAALLVQREREEECDREVQRLDRELGHRLVFKYFGPLPPYNFVNIVVSWQEL